MIGYIKLVSTGGTVIKRLFTDLKTYEKVYKEVLSQKSFWEQNYPHQFPDGLKIVDDAHGKRLK